MTVWRHLAPPPSSAAEAIAKGQCLLSAIEVGDDPLVVTWQVNEPAVVVGRGSREGIIDPERCAQYGVPMLARASGGGPLIWDAGLLAFDLLIPRGHPLAPDDVVESYRFAGDAIVRAVAWAGGVGRRLDVEEARDAKQADTHPAAQMCFGGWSPHEVVAGTRKIAGLSQARRTTGTLIQGGILLTDSQLDLAQFAADAAVTRDTLERRMSSLKRQGAKHDPEHVANLLVRALNSL